MDTSREDAIKVQMDKNKILTFRCVGKGLYVCDFAVLMPEPATSRHDPNQYNFAQLG